MNRPVAFALAALTLTGLAHSARAQYGYPAAPEAAGYPPVYGQPMGYMPMPYPPMGYNPYGPGVMPVTAGQPMVQPIMVPVVVTRTVPVFGALETMPAGGPLDAQAMETLAIRQGAKPAVPEAAPAPTPVTVQTTSAKTTAPDVKKQAPAAAAADKAPAAEPAKPKTWWRIKWLDGK